MTTISKTAQKSFSLQTRQGENDTIWSAFQRSLILSNLVARITRNTKKMIRLATVFSGIGAIEHALYRMGLEHEIVFACDNGDVDVLSRKVEHKIEKIIEAFRLLENDTAAIRQQAMASTNQNIVFQFEYFDSQKGKFAERLTAQESLTDKVLKDLAERLEMLIERLETVKVLLKLDALPTKQERKAFVDKLYEGKEKSNKVKTSYLANYQVDPNDFHWNVSFLDGRDYAGGVDLFVGGSPCQSFSLVGKQRGLADTRGTLFYEFARLVQEIQPKVFIYENVKAVLSNDNGKTWKTMQRVFTDLNYVWKMKVLNAKDYGIPQNRARIFVVGIRRDIPLAKEFEFPPKQKLERFMKDFLIDNPPGKYYLPEKGVKFVADDGNLTKRYTQINGEIALCQKKNQQFNWHGDFVFVPEDNIQKTDLEKYYLSAKVRAYVLATGTKTYCTRPKIDLDIARPLLTTMHKMHRAGVDNYVTTEGRIRKLTPRECLRLMGFSDSFKIVVSDTSMYQQAGNSIVVDVLIRIMEQIIATSVFE